MKRMKSLSMLCVCLSIMVMSLPCLASGPLDNWTKINPPLTLKSSTFWSVAYGGGYLYAVGEDGLDAAIMYSNDGGAKWYDYGLALHEWLYGVSYRKDKYGFGHWVAVGNNGTLLVDWLLKDSKTTEPLFAVQSNRAFCAAGANGTVTCDGEDGASWSKAAWTGTTEDLMGIACADTNQVPCIAVGANGAISREFSGNSPLPIATDLLGLAWGKGTYVAVGLSSTILTSHDGGYTWKVVAKGEPGAYGGVTFADDTFVVVGSLGQIRTSSNGDNWIIRDLSSSDALHSVAFDSNTNRWVAVGSGGAIYRSDPTTSIPTSTGTDVKLYFSEAGTTVTFPKVTSSGNTYVNTGSSVTDHPPGNFATCDPMTWYDIHTTATFTPPATVCINYDGRCTDPSKARLLHYENGKWVDVTTSNDPINHIVCGQVNSFSLFAVEARAVDNAPVITGASASPSVLWPPNNKLVDVTINYSSTDDWSTPVCRIANVRSSEPITSKDYFIVDPHHVQLLAQRLGSGNGRDYDVTIACVDDIGQSTSQHVTVSVPHDQGNKSNK